MARLLGGLNVRPAEPSDAAHWARMRDALWPVAEPPHTEEIRAWFVSPPDRAECFVAELDGAPVGFVEAGLRDYAEACRSSPVGYLEGIWVEPKQRRSGAGRALVEAAEAWASSRGCTEVASDRALDDAASGAFHEAMGYREAHRIVCYRKELG